MQNFFSWGLYVGQVAGIRIRIHGLLLIWWAVEFNNTVLAGPVEQRKVRSAIWALGALLVFLSILLHELGHCFAARRVGGDALCHALRQPVELGQTNQEFIFAPTR